MFAKDHSHANPITKYFERVYLINYCADLQAVSVYNLGMNEEHFKLRNKILIFW